MPLRALSWLICLLLPALLDHSPASAVPGPAPAEAPAGLSVTLTPRPLASGTIGAIDVQLHLRDTRLAAGDILAEMAVVRVMAPSALARPDTFTARDADGPLALDLEEDAPDPALFRQDRRWRASRASRGDILITYTIEPRQVDSSTRPGPLIDTRTERTGFYGSGNTMLALPVDGWPREVELFWDLSLMEAGTRAASSLGEGNVRARLGLQDLSNTFFMAGPLLSEPADGQGDFVVYWMTPPVFDMAAAASWTRQAYDWFSGFFGARGAGFRIFMRTTAIFQGGGGGGYNSFIFGNVEGEGRDDHELRSLLAHEALHHFVGGYGAGGGAGGQQWYSEGVTSYYTIVLPYRAGLTGPDRFIADFNALAASYYANPRAGLSNAEVTRLFFSDRNAQLLPYHRGPLYIALTDAMIRSASPPLRVDDLIFDFIAALPGETDGVALWHDLVSAYLGEAGSRAFRDMMDGAPLDLPSDLFGPCFEAEDRMIQVPLTDFRTYRDEEGRIRIGPVTPGSSAEAAGIRRYDILLNPEALEAARADGPPGRAQLEILRDSDTLTLAYAPWSDPVGARQWVRTGVDESACNL